MRRIINAVMVVLTITGLAVAVSSPASAAEANPIYVLKNRAGGNCLDVRNGGMNDFDVVDLYRCYGGPVQQWERIFVADQHAYELMNEHSKKCLDVRFGSQAVFAPVDQYTCYPEDQAELWYLDNHLGAGKTFFINVLTHQALDDYYGGTADFTPADQYPVVEGDPAEMWCIQTQIPCP